MLTIEVDGAAVNKSVPCLCAGIQVATSLTDLTTDLFEPYAEAPPFSSAFTAAQRKPCPLRVPVRVHRWQ
jgi:hypothetical protein